MAGDFLVCTSAVDCLEIVFSTVTYYVLNGLDDGTVAHCWRLGVVASVVRHMNEVNVHWARLVLGWVTVFGRVYHHGV